MRPALSDRMRRTLAMLSWLAVHEEASLAELADRFGVTERQIRNDIEMAGTSVFGDGPEAERRWLEVYIDDDDDTVRAHALPVDLIGPTRLGREEAFAVLAAGRAALETDPSLDPLRSAMAKLAGVLDVGLEGEVDVDLATPACVADFRAAAERGEQLEIGYWSAWRDDVTSRTVGPLYVFFRSGSWYARCVDDRPEPAPAPATRLFRLDRVTRCRRTGTAFTPPPRVDPDAAVFDRPDESREVVVRFPWSARWVLDYLELRDVTTEVAADGTHDHLTGTVDAVGTAFLDQLLVRTRGEVIDPPDLRGRTAVAARAILDRYR